MTNDYEVKGFRAINGHDGQGWEANLYHNGKKIAEAFDDGWGGEVEIRWMSKRSDNGKVVRQRIEALRDVHVPAIGAILQSTEGWWSEFLKAEATYTPWSAPEKDADGNPIFTFVARAPGMLISDTQVAWFIEAQGRLQADQKRVTRILAKQIVIAKEDGSMLQWKRLPKKVGALARAGRDAAIKDSIRTKYPDALILNDAPIEIAHSHIFGDA